MSEKEKEKEQADVAIKAVDMPAEQQQRVIALVTEALEKYSSESEIATYIKKSLDATDSPTWHCIVGISFGSMVAHTKDHFIHLKIRAPKLKGFNEVSVKNPKALDWCYVLIFKTA